MSSASRGRGWSQIVHVLRFESRAWRARLLVVGVLAVPAVGLVLTAVAPLAVVARTIEVLGSVCTLVGLLVGYLRALDPEASVRGQLRAFAQRALGATGKPAAGAAPPAEADDGTRRSVIEPPLIAAPDFDGLTAQQQVDALIDYIRTAIAPRSTQTSLKLDELGDAIEMAHAHAEQRAAESLHLMDSKFDKLLEQIDRVAVLDLSVAIFGVYVAAVGITMGFWA